MGRAGAINYGITQSQGKFITFLDAAAVACTVACTFFPAADEYEELQMQCN